MSIGIIGGADGPTQLFVGSGKEFIGLAIGVVAVVGAIVILIIKAKKRRK
jgi:Na+-transporting methylmalonyl-CoA/oxaloacetate decarboxylase beta subunit